MPARQPFTRLCQQTRARLASRVDLHIHTTCSDGLYTPAEVINVAHRSGLPALAITDHDTILGLEPARTAAAEKLEIIAGVELTASFQGRLMHLLAYFFDPQHDGLRGMLAGIQERRRHRFREMIGRLGRDGVHLDCSQAETFAEGPAPGRRHVAQLLVKAGRAATIRQAFLRYLGDAAAPLHEFAVPIADAIQIIRQAGGIAAWAHPSYDCTRQALVGLREQGLAALEVSWPSCRPSRSRELRTWAAELGLAVTGGSDCHGPGNHKRAIGSSGITLQELELLRAKSVERN